MAGALGSGFTGGMLESQLDLQSIQLNKFKIAEAPIKLQEEQITLQRDKVALAQQVRAMSLMQNIKPPQDANSPGGMADVLNQMAWIQIQSGNPEEARKLSSTASQLLENSSKTDSRSYRMQNDRLSKFSNILDAVPDSQQGFAAAIQAMLQADPGAARDPRFAQIAQQPWRPGMMEGLKRAVLTAKEQAEINYRQQAGDHAAAAAETDRARVGLIAAQKQLAIDRDANLDKEGASKVKSSDIKAITSLVKQTYGADADPDDVYSRSLPLAEQMVKMRREQSLTTSEAARRVFKQAQDGQVFAGLRMPRVQPGTKPDVPLQLPAKTSSMTVEEWKKKLQVNRYYPQGVWDGKNFVSEAEMAAKKRPRPDEDDEDEVEAEEAEE